MVWRLNEANISQVTVNILDHEITPIHLVYEEVYEDANIISEIEGYKTLAENSCEEILEILAKTRT
jgi:glutamate formiminotransferase